MRLTVPPRGGSLPAGGSRPRTGGFPGPVGHGQAPHHVIKRQGGRLKERLGRALPVAEVEAASLDPGSFVFLWCPGPASSPWGEPGKPAEKMADLAVEEFLTFTRRQAALDRHLTTRCYYTWPLPRGSRFSPPRRSPCTSLPTSGSSSGFTGPGLRSRAIWGNQVWLPASAGRNKAVIRENFV